MCEGIHMDLHPVMCKESAGGIVRGVMEGHDDLLPSSESKGSDLPRGQ